MEESKNSKKEEEARMKNLGRDSLHRNYCEPTDVMDQNKDSVCHE